MLQGAILVGKVILQATNMKTGLGLDFMNVKALKLHATAVV